MATNRTAINLLYIFPGLLPPPKDPATAEWYHLGGDIDVDILLPTWMENAQSLHTELGDGSFPVHRVSNRLRYHVLLAGKYKFSSFRQKAAIFWFQLKKGLQIGRTKKIDCIMTYGAGLGGVVAYLLSRILGAKLIVRLPNVPENAYRYTAFGGKSFHFSAKAGLKTRVARRTADVLLRFLVLHCDRVCLMYPYQLQKYPKLQKVPASVIHSFTAMSRIPHAGNNDGSVLLVGAPWFLKGADILIRAFRKIEAEFPDTNVHLLGHFPDEQFLREMIGHSRQIEILAARPNPEVLQIIANCSIYALSSRTDAAPRVVIEAMAAGKPVVGSRVGGVAHYIREGETGLLFESENADELAEKLRLLLNSPELRARLGRNGYRIARAQYNEAEWGRKLKELIELTVLGRTTESEEKQNADVCFTS